MNQGVNEITSVNADTSPVAYDANGNTLTDGSGKHFVYDAWNRLVAVTGGTNTIETMRA